LDPGITNRRAGRWTEKRRHQVEESCQKHGELIAIAALVPGRTKKNSVTADGDANL
jgi:hypothetical protein